MQLLDMNYSASWKFWGIMKSKYILKTRKNLFSITDCGTYCYNIILFGVKNVRATSQHQVNCIFSSQIGKVTEVYIDIMMVKS